MSQSAQLRTYNFVLPDFRRRKMDGNLDARHGVLLQTKLAHVKIVDDVLRTKLEFDLVVYGNCQRRNDNVVLRGRIIQIQPDRIAR